MTSRDVDAGPTAPTDVPDAPSRRRPWWRESLLLLGVATVLAIVVKALFVQAFYIPSESMEPGLVKDDRILVQKVSYWGPGAPHRGDVVVFDDPGGWLTEQQSQPTGPVARLLGHVGLFPTGGHLVKRVIGIGGDTVVCCDEGGRISVNGHPLDEDAYISPQSECNGPMPYGALHCHWSVGPIPDGELFVMGDNRGRSADSSAHLCTSNGCERGEEYVDTDLVVGRVLALVWPVGHADLVRRPAAFDGVPDPA